MTVFLEELKISVVVELLRSLGAIPTGTHAIEEMLLLIR